MPLGPLDPIPAKVNNRQTKVEIDHINEVREALSSAYSATEVDALLDALPAGATVHVQPDEPADPDLGMLWFDTDATASGGSAGTGSDMALYLSDYSPDPTGATSSKTAVENLIADIVTNGGGRGGTMYVEPGIYDVGSGIVENTPGLRVVGLSTRKLSPGEVEDIGVVFRSDDSGAWVWTHGPTSVASNEYSGAAFENVTFAGTASDGSPAAGVAGGLRLLTNNNVVRECGAFRFSTGVGFQTAIPAGGADDASWNHYHSCYAVDCFGGFDMGAGVQTGQNGSHLIGCVTIKTGNPSAVAQHTGYGIRISSLNTTVLGGKVEQEGEGLLVTAYGGVTVTGLREEQCDIGFHLNRPSGAAYASNITMTGLVSQNPVTTSVQVGAENWNDIIVGNFAGDIVDNGRGTRVVGQPDIINASTIGGAVQRFVGHDGTTALETQLWDGGNITYEVTDTTFGAGVFFELPDSANTFFRIQNGNGPILTLNGNGAWAFGAEAVKPTVSGSKGGNAALDSLLDALVSLGLVTDSTT